jgi:hypothetical protein
MIDSKGRDSVLLGASQSGNARLKRKAGASSRTPNVVIYDSKYSRGYGKVNGNFGSGASFRLFD